MRPLRKVYTMTATDADGIGETQTPLAAGDLVIDGVLASGGVVTLSIGQHVTITSVGDDSGRTFTVYGENNSGAPITEAITGVSAGAATGTLNFKKVTQVTTDAATADAITIGIEGTAEFDWVPLDHFIAPFEYAYYVNIGTATYQVESTLDDPQTTTPIVNATVKASGGSDGGGTSTAPATAIRIKVTAFTSGDIVLNVLQSGR